MKEIVASLLIAAYAQVPTTLEQCKIDLAKTIRTYERKLDVKDERHAEYIQICEMRMTNLQEKLKARTSTVIQVIAPEPVVVDEGFDALEVTAIAGGSALVAAAVAVLATVFLVKRFDGN